MLTDEFIKAVMLSHGFTVKEGLTDLKPYVYAAARSVESAATAPLLARIAELEKDVAHKDAYAEQLGRELAIAARELEEARKDAERYRWIRNSTLVDGEINETMYVAIESPDWPNKWALVGEDLDAAIDAAIKEQT